MSFPSRKAAIVGVYTTEQARGLDRTPVSLQLESIKGALADAGLEASQVDGLIPVDRHPQPWVRSAHAHMYWAAQLGGRPISYMDTGMAAGGVAKAALAVAAGMCNVAVFFWGKSGRHVGPKGSVVPTVAPRVDDWSYEIQGAYMVPWYAMWTRRYMHEFGATPEELALVPVVHRHHATLNPDSIMGSKGEISVDDVLTSRMVSDPLRLLDCSLDNDGGYAIVIASEEIAKDCRTQPVWVLGGAEAVYTDFYATINDPWFPEEGNAARRSADLAFEMAGVGREEIDVAGLYDCFPVTMLRDLEELGFCKLGEGAAYFQEGHTRLGGSMPCNTDGGLLSNSHNAQPSGMHTIEVVRQLRGECGPRQVVGAKIGLSFAQGNAVHGHAGTLVMAVD